MAGEHVLGTTSEMSEATDAFQAAMDAETPSRSRQGNERKKDERQSQNDLFPNRKMDRSESEGGESADDPEPVKKAKAERQPKDEPSEEIHDDDEATEPNDDDEEYDEDDDEQEQDKPDDDEDEEEAASGKFDPDLVVRIQVDGEPVEVSLGEMAKGYTRTATFHKRMGELSQGVQALHSAKTELDGYHNAHIARVQELESYIEAFMPKEPDWNALRQADPTQAANLRFEWEDFQRKRYALAQSREQAQAAVQTAYQERLEQFISANRAALANRHPEWKQEKVWRRDNESMRRTARAAGYTDEEIKELFDARAVEILLKAARYDRNMAAKPKPVRSVPKNGNGATPRKRNVSSSFDRAERRLSRGGSIGDAASAFERILDRER